MGLSTHVLDTMHGCPAAGMGVELYKIDGELATPVKTLVLNADGRTPDGPLYKDGELKSGNYRLVFDVAGYFKARGACLPEPNFLNRVTLDGGYTFLNATFESRELVNGSANSTQSAGNTIAINAGNRIPLIPQHSATNAGV